MGEIIFTPVEHSDEEILEMLKGIEFIEKSNPLTKVANKIKSIINPPLVLIILGIIGLILLATVTSTNATEKKGGNEQVVFEKESGLIYGDDPDYWNIN